MNHPSKFGVRKNLELEPCQSICPNITTELRENWAWHWPPNICHVGTPSPHEENLIDKGVCEPCLAIVCLCITRYLWRKKCPVASLGDYRDAVPWTLLDSSWVSCAVMLSMGHRKEVVLRWPVACMCTQTHVHTHVDCSERNNGCLWCRWFRNQARITIPGIQSCIKLVQNFLG